MFLPLPAGVSATARTFARPRALPRSRAIVTHACDDGSNKLNAPAQLRQFCPFQFRDRTRESRDATRASGGENLMAFRGRFDVRQPSIS
jgi:hypothetical protein